MANGYEQFFKKAKESRSDGGPRAAASEKRFVMNEEKHGAAEGRDSEKSRAEMIQELRRRVQKRRVKRARKFPTSIVLVSVIGSGLAGFGMSNHEQLERWFGQIEVVVLGQAQAQEAAPAAAPEKAADDKVAADDKSTSTAAAPVSANDWKDEDVNHFRKMVDRKKELDAREAELNRQEAELQTQRDALEVKLKELTQTRTNISNVLQEKVAEDEKKVATLVDVYSSMKPVQAAKVLESMDEDLAVQILGRMKKKNAAEVLNLMKAEKAQSFSEKFAGYRKN